MRLNDDLSKPVIIHAGRMDWVRSPAAGVERRMLFRIGGEVARATSIVRYAPGSAFPRHVHGGGEEILVLEGVFQDEHGDYPAGCYFRNPPGTSHVPASKPGCTIFVRLWQFREGDAAQVVRQPEADASAVLFDDGHEAVRLRAWEAGAAVDVDNPRGLEFLVLSGGLTTGGESLEPQSWGRLPAGTGPKGVAGPAGARLWIRDAPLLHPDILPMP
ncbi:cupin [Dankookia rubra]|uniref:Cupin n=1 Tax=Dankookia rubra TaxID=1442381 RepID=A0A4R5QA59_9PROT|nr:cupin domain-containing protein [Dankookia rubra]TDH59920.1 cupin [Dankookia rubra]